MSKSSDRLRHKFVVAAQKHGVSGAKPGQVKNVKRAMNRKLKRLFAEEYLKRQDGETLELI